ncbi:hypothetical protein Tco_1464666 [Tanacetum coccineum]
MSSSTHPIIIIYDFYIEDVFSSTTTLDYTPASPDYSPSLPRNISYDPSRDLSKDLLASLVISPFHNDPYMKVMQAYNATNDESPIPLPQASIAPPTILPSQKRARSRSSSSTSALPQIFEIGESSHKTSLERYEEQIETILNHLDELTLKTSTLEILIEDIQIHHRSDMKSLLDKIHELKNYKGGPPDY